MPDPRRIRGEVNAILDGLVQDGVITGFKTNFENPASLALALHVRVTADIVTDMRNPGYDEKRVRSIRNRVAKDIEGLSPGVIVSVRQTPDRTAPPAPSPPTLGQQCRQARLALGWSLEALADRAGVSKEAISSFERGKRAPRPETLAAIIGALQAAGVVFRNGDETGVKLREVKPSGDAG